MAHRMLPRGRWKVVCNDREYQSDLVSDSEPEVADTPEPEVVDTLEPEVIDLVSESE
jgi:hypothetical protein